MGGVLTNSKMKEITINIPFTYEVGEEGPFTGKVIRNTDDAMAEVSAEIDAGWPHNSHAVFMAENKSRWIDVQDIDPEADLVKPCLVELFLPGWELPVGGITYGVWAMIDRQATVNGVPWENLKHRWSINRFMLFDHHEDFFSQHNL